MLSVPASGMIRARDSGPEYKSVLEEVIGGKVSELAGLPVKGLLPDKLLFISGNQPDLPETVPPMSSRPEMSNH